PPPSTLSLHDALPICPAARRQRRAQLSGMATQLIFPTLLLATDADIRRSLRARMRAARARVADGSGKRLNPSPTSSTLTPPTSRSEEHTSELQSQSNL